MLEVLKELNIHDIKDFLNKAKLPDKSFEPFEKDTRATPAQYHLESSCGTVSRGFLFINYNPTLVERNLKILCVLSSLGDGLIVVDNDHNVPTVGELVNHKHGKHQQRGNKATIQLEVVGVYIS